MSVVYFLETEVIVTHQRDGFLSLFILLGHMLKLIATNFSFFGETLDSSPNLPAEIIQSDPFRESDL